MISLKEVLEEKGKIETRKIRYLKLKRGEQRTIRIVPKSLRVNELPFMERYVYHTSQGHISSPLNYGESDPVYEFSDSLKMVHKRYDLGKNLEPKLTTQVSVIDRGNNGKRLFIWNMGKSTYENLLSELIKYEDDNPLCPVKGYDIILEKDMNDHTHITIIPVSKMITTNHNKLIDLVCESSSIEDHFRRIDQNQWSEINSLLRQEHFFGNLDEGSFNKIFNQVTSSIELSI
jgi:hypothetical protein